VDGTCSHTHIAAGQWLNRPPAPEAEAHAHRAPGASPLLAGPMAKAKTANGPAVRNRAGKLVRVEQDLVKAFALARPPGGGVLSAGGMAGYPRPWPAFFGVFAEQ
jgi:hypothetical protein